MSRFVKHWKDIGKFVFIAAAGNDGPDVIVYPAAFDLKNWSYLLFCGDERTAHPISGKATAYSQLPAYKNLISLPKIEIFRGIKDLQKRDIQEATSFSISR